MSDVVEMPTQRVVLTGGPGAGKTALLSEFRSRGYATVSESAREVIEGRRGQGLSPRPPPREFAEEILRRDIEKYQLQQSERGLVFFDRGALEALGMLEDIEPLTASELDVFVSAYPYHRDVFVLPPWEAIYTNDAARDQTFDDAVRVHESVTRWYRRCGYEPIEVPRGAVAERCNFVLARLGREGA